jgi:hypothetical protein
MAAILYTKEKWNEVSLFLETSSINIMIHGSHIGYKREMKWGIPYVGPSSINIMTHGSHIGYKREMKWGVPFLGPSSIIDGP